MPFKTTTTWIYEPCRWSGITSMFSPFWNTFPMILNAPHPTHPTPCRMKSGFLKWSLRPFLIQSLPTSLAPLTIFRSTHYVLYERKLVRRPNTPSQWPTLGLYSHWYLILSTLSPPRSMACSAHPDWPSSRNHPALTWAPQLYLSMVLIPFCFILIYNRDLSPSSGEHPLGAGPNSASDLPQQLLTAWGAVQ